MNENRLTEEEISTRVDLLAEMLQCNGKMYLSRYNSEGTLLSTNAEDAVYDTMLRSSVLLQEAMAFYQTSSKPLAVSTEIGMMWSVIFHKNEEDQGLYLYILGPVFSSKVSGDSLKDILTRWEAMNLWKKEYTSLLDTIPTVSSTDFFKYSLMLEKCVNNEYLKPSEITFSNHGNVEANGKSFLDWAEYWNRENVILNFIRTGDIYYKGKIASASSVLQDFYPVSSKELSQVRYYASIFVGLCSRAAIEGGVAPDTAFTRRGMYIQTIAAANSFAEIMSACHAAFEDFLFIVYQIRQVPVYSEAINACVRYIMSHTDEPLSIDYLAEKIGYSKYYLSKKFKTEVGMNINSYIKQQRIERACYLLATSRMSIQNISDTLHFGNRNFFTKTFKEVVGSTPAAYRSNHRKKI